MCNYRCPHGQTENFYVVSRIASGEHGVQIFHTLCNKIRLTGQWPNEWARTVVDITLSSNPNSGSVDGQYGCSKNLVYLLQRLLKMDQPQYAQMTFYPNTPNRWSPQERIISPLLFNVYTKLIIRIIPEAGTEGESIGGLKISILRYGDDTTLFATSTQKKKTSGRWKVLTLSSDIR